MKKILLITLISLAINHILIGQVHNYDDKNVIYSNEEGKVRIGLNTFVHEALLHVNGRIHSSSLISTTGEIMSPVFKSVNGDVSIILNRHTTMPRMHFRNTTTGATWQVGTLGGTGVDDFSIGAYYQTGNTGNITLTSLGDVGIGTRTPAYKLHVNGAINASQLYIGGQAINFNNAVTSVWGQSGTTINYVGGNVGIGTATPGYQLDVSGIINTTEGIKINGFDILKTNTDHGIFIGRTGVSNPGINNIFIGGDAGTNTTLEGQNNVFIGRIAGQSNIEGDNNVFVGQAAGQVSTSSSENVLIGYGAGRYIENQQDAQNVMIGFLAGSDIGSGYEGSKNTILGHRSGFKSRGSENVYIGGNSGENVIGSNNVFIGNMSGYNQTGSNKLYIENSDSATPLIYGEFDQDKVGINTTNLVGDYSLFVRDGIITEKVVVEVEGEWPDYVFQPNYQLPALKDVAGYIQQHKHLPEIPSAAEIEKEGLNLGEMEALMMKKIEELTLYAIEQETKVEEVRQEKDVEIEKLEVRIVEIETEKEALKKRLEKLEQMMKALMNK